MAARGQRADRPDLLAFREGRPPRPRRSTAPRSSGCAALRTARGRICGDSGVGVSVVMPGFIRDAGMFADTGSSCRRASARAPRAGRRGGDRRDRAQPRRGGGRAARSASRSRRPWRSAWLPAALGQRLMGGADLAQPQASSRQVGEAAVTDRSEWRLHPASIRWMPANTGTRLATASLRHRPGRQLPDPVRCTSRPVPALVDAWTLRSPGADAIREHDDDRREVGPAANGGRPLFHTTATT